MIRRYTDRPVDPGTVRTIVELGLRAPSAGFSQGWDFVVLDEPAARQRFWDASLTKPGGDARDADDAAEHAPVPTDWLAGVMAAPVLIVCCSDKNVYLQRYTEPDKPFQDGSESHWPVPYWDVDTGMAAMIMLLAAQDAGLGALFFGVPVEQLDAVRTALRIPADRNIVGVIALGHPATTTPSGSTRSRKRRDTAEVVHYNGFGGS
ncbi:nitroreductase family protein [Nakamurella sp. DB0629]|uniref:Nitroreductase family protein n=2 Tax=Nakamurella aerolata TaxID=1656892 RepID=A0A849AC60_9ACTN|nr:nitroreductase family protein [Nakamurella aerolata]